MENYILCCDWGTTFFRLRLITLSNDQLVGEVLSQGGIASTFDTWRSNGNSVHTSRKQFFRQELQKQIGLLAARLSINLDGIPVLISGMASSSIGMEEVPYSDLPFALDGSGASIKRVDAQAEFPHPLMLISGVKSFKDVMRGEETQLVGLVDLMRSSSGIRLSDAIFIFPGTHSKHIYIHSGELVNFETYMTGEVFGLMANHSILKDSVETEQLNELSEEGVEAFKFGIHESGSSNILYGLFTVRTNQLFGSLNKKQNSMYMSGLLIGTELRQLLDKKDHQLVLCSGSKLQVFYQLAIQELGLAERTTIISAELIDQAAFVGQIRIFQNQNLQKVI